MPGEPRHGGLGCAEVLEALSEFLDGDVSDELRASIEQHLGDCDWCERFGGRFAQMVSGLREEVGPAEPLSEELVARLLQAAQEDAQ
jgi:predicted anti-sigma-YlaC factor YlaD